MHCSDSYGKDVEREQEPDGGASRCQIYTVSARQGIPVSPKRITYPKYTAAAIGRRSVSGRDEQVAFS